MLLSLGVSGDGGLPLRLGVRDGHRRDSVATPVAIEECLALGVEGLRGIVAARKASSRRTLGGCLEQKGALITLGPRPGAVRPELEAWGRQQCALPLVVETPGRTKAEAPRRWHGHSVRRQGEVAYSDGRGALATLRFVVVPSSQLAPPQTQASTAAQEKEARAVAEHGPRVQARGLACAADAEAASAEYEPRGPGRRGRRPQAWRYPAVRYRGVADTRRRRRVRRGRPAKTEPPPMESGYRLVVEVENRPNAEEDHGWPGLAPTVPTEAGADAEILQADQEQNTTVEPGFRWIKKPAAIAPVWLEQPARMAALAMLTVLGGLVSRVIQRQVRLYLHTPDQQRPGNKGLTATPTAAVVLALCSHVALVQFWIDEQEVTQLSGVRPYHLWLCDALGLDSSWYEVSSAPKNGRDIQTP